MISEDIVKEIAGRDTPTGEMTVEACIATELLELRADAKTSQNHNAGVIDRIVDQLREAGYTGTLSEMVDAVVRERDNYYMAIRMETTTNSYRSRNPVEVE